MDFFKNFMASVLILGLIILLCFYVFIATYQTKVRLDCKRPYVEIEMNCYDLTEFKK